MPTSWKYTFGFLFLIIAGVWLADFQLPDSKLHLIVCDVGQGDAILAVYKSTQILVDGGADAKVLDCLSRHMPFWDREIELVELTHPQLDHFGGLVDVFKRYKVDTFLANGLDSSSLSYEALKKVVGGSGAKVINPKEGMTIRLGLLYLDIVAPTESLLEDVEALPLTNKLGVYTSKRDPNDFSVVSILRLGSFDALLTGDIGPNEIPDVLATGRIGKVEYIKIPHHGSKNGLTKELLEASVPEIAVISVGKNNRYGHPHEEVLNMLTSYGLRVLRTDEDGDVEVISDGETVWIKP